MKQLLIIGAGGNGKVIADIAEKNGYERIAFLDDDDSVKMCGGYQVIGKCKDVLRYNSDVIISIGNAGIRQRIQEKLEKMEVFIPTLVHPNAVIGANVELGIGTIVAAGAVINSDSKIGKGCIINTSSSVDHDCMIEDFVHISVGAHLAGTVKVGARTWVGIGAVVSNNLEISSDCMIGAGAVVVSSIREKGTYVGVPAKRLK